MVKVDNRKVISNIAKKSLKANRTRNSIAIIAIVLTSIMFTTLFTISGVIANSFQQQSFRQGGSDFHGNFKNVTMHQMQELEQDPLIVKQGRRKILGRPTDIPFNKVHVEVSYMDKVNAQGFFCIPEEGRLPREETDEIACDTRILKLLGVEPKVGEKLTLSYYIGHGDNRKLITDTFTLSGFWEYDSAIMASNALVALSYTEKVLEGYERDDKNDYTGQWIMNIYLKSTSNIRTDLETILSNRGFQYTDEKAQNYIGIGVNWAYLGAQLSNNADIGTILSMLALLLLIVLTGYLIIYNIFRISVINDIRFFGLLKTIGTTGKQLKLIILKQAVTLSAVGIPIGLIVGFLCGNVLAPFVMKTLSFKRAYITTNPLIFVGAAVFTLITVLISCSKPGRIASKVSPVEAVKYLESTGSKKKKLRKSNKINLINMALANLGRSKKKTILVVLSLSLAVVILHITVTFTGGFDMDKYLRRWVVADFILADANYFQVGGELFNERLTLTEEAITDVNEQINITESGRIYGKTSDIKTFTTEDLFRKEHSRFNDVEAVERLLNNQERNADGDISTNIQLYGMEDYALKQLNVIEGDISDLYDPDKKAIVAVYLTDDYGNIISDSNWANVGDEITLRYVDEFEYRDAKTGKILHDSSTTERGYLKKAVEYKDITYTVVASVTMRYSMSYRYSISGYDEFALNAEVFKDHSNTSGIMTYIFDTKESTNKDMETYLEHYTTKINPSLDYESKQSYEDDFNGFRNMFLLMGGILSFIIGLVGILNFFNSILTSIMTRKREFAMLQAIGMTGKQLKTMLIWEGIFYGIFTVALSLLLILATAPLFNLTISSMFWFFTYRFTLVPVAIVTPLFLLLGFLLPLVTYRFASKQSIVERLREVD